MGRPSEAEALASAWRALAGSAGSGGWRTIPVTAGGTCRILAGRQLPGDEEAVLIGLRPARIPAADQLPEGHGFSVQTVDPGLESAAVSGLHCSVRLPGASNFSL